MRKQFADPDVLTGKIKSHIRKRADEEVAAAKAKAPDDWRKRNEIEKRRDQALERVQDLVETIRKGLAGEPDPIFVEAAEILDKQGVDEAIKYLEQKQPTIEKKISSAKSLRDHAEQHSARSLPSQSASGRPLRSQSEVGRQHSRFVKRLRERILDGSKLGAYSGAFLYRLARYGKAEPHLQAAVEMATNPVEEATGFSDLALLLRATNRMAEAEPLYRRALAIDERSYGPDHPDRRNRTSTTWRSCSGPRTGWRRPSRSIAVPWRSTSGRTAPTTPTSQPDSTTWRSCSGPRTGWRRPSRCLAVRWRSTSGRTAPTTPTSQ